MEVVAGHPIEAGMLECLAHHLEGAGWSRKPPATGAGEDLAGKLIPADIVRVGAASSMITTQDGNSRMPRPAADFGHGLIMSRQRVAIERSQVPLPCAPPGQLGPLDGECLAGSAVRLATGRLRGREDHA